MSEQTNLQNKAQGGAEDSGRYFQYMADFVGLSKEDNRAIQQTASIIEHHLPEIVSKFYSHLLRYPPTRKFFLKKDGSIDQEYVELRMRHLTNFWLRAAKGNFDDEFARYVDYVGRAHTAHGADPTIYIAERYVIGQVGFMQHAINEAITNDLRDVDDELETTANEAWDRLMMVILEMLARAYGNEREAETFDALVTIDQQAVDRMAQEAFTLEHDKDKPVAHKDMLVGRADEIPENSRKIVHVGATSIGIFHHKGQWFAYRNSCLHRGGPVCTGTLDGDTLTCPWHGFQYNVTDGHLLVDPAARLENYDVSIVEGDIHLLVPDFSEPASASASAEAPADAPAPAPVANDELNPNEFHLSDVAPGQTVLVHLDGQGVAVFNLDGTFHATQAECTHEGGPLNEGKMDGETVTCPWHGSCFNVKTGEVVHGPARQPIQTFRVTIDGAIGRIESL
jgi:nitrite reductase/ring-hydroxylating ferredoxin subunit/hemoglobin-like flavoprotein